MPINRAQERPAKTEQASNNKSPSQVKLTEWRTGITQDAPSNRAWYPQGIVGATYAPGPQVVYLGQRLRSQRNQKLKVSDHAPSKNRNTTNIFSGIRLMDRTQIKNSRNPVKATTNPFRLIRGSYQAAITPCKRLQIFISYTSLIL